MLTRILYLLLFFTLLTPPSSGQAPSKSTLTLEWIFSDEGRRVASLPSNQWLADGKLMLYDGRLPAAQRAFEILDPETGARRTALDMKVAVASLNTLLPGSPITNVLPWPQSFDPSGRRALYIFNGD